MRLNKTGRKRGVIWNHIRSVGKAKRRFTLDDIVSPVVTRVQARDNANAMMRFGVVTRVADAKIVGWQKTISAEYKLIE